MSREKTKIKSTTLFKSGLQPSFLLKLEEFLTLECPLLVPETMKLGMAAQTPHDLHDALMLCLEERLRLPDVPRELWPFATTADAMTWARADLLEQIEGFFRRQEIRDSITREERLQLFRDMVLTREVDATLKRAFVEKKVKWGEYPSPQKGFRSLGQEAIVGVALRLRHGDKHGRGESYSGDVIGPVIRDLGAMIAWTGDVENALFAQAGKKGGPMDGRDLHIGDLDRGVLPPTAPLAIASQTLIGIAYAAKLDKSDRVCVSFIGEGGSSLGEWHEAINFAAVQQLAMIFFVENNHWALGTHWKEQTAAKRFALKAAGYGLPGITISGNDPEDVAAATAWAAERARAGKGPALIELVTYRRPGHAHHDDDRYNVIKPGYEFEEERKAWEAKDPVALYDHKFGAEEVEAVTREAAERVRQAVAKVEAAAWPEPSDFLGRVFATRTDPVPSAAPAQTRAMGYDEAVRAAMEELLESDPRVFLLGEDIGGRYGGAFGVTRGLAKKFGAERVLNTILAESAIVGCAVGAALMGKRPIVEMQFADFLAPGFNALVNNAPKIHWRYGKRVPMVVRLPYGGATGTMNKLLGGGPFHSQCPEAWFMRTPGWKIVAPSTPRDAKGLLTAAVRDGNPVIYLEAKGLYSFFRTDLREEVPVGPDFEVPIGQAAVRREGKDVSCITYGAMTWTALAAAEELAKEGIALEVVDLRTLVPLDVDTMLASVAKTSRALILHEDARTAGPGAEFAAIIAEKALYELEAPVMRVTPPDTPVPYSPPLEYAYLPNAEDVVRAARSLMR